MDLYRVFYAVAKKGSLTKAAAELYISQPAVSQAIKQLENQLGVPLFNRTHRGMELSEEGGKRIFHRVERALGLLEEAETEVGETFDKKGELKISVSEEAFRYLFAEKAAHFSKKYPSVRVKLTQLKDEKLQEALLSGKIDVALSARPCLSEGGIVSYPTGVKIESAYLAGKKYAEKFSATQKSGKETLVPSAKNLPRIALAGEEDNAAVVSGADAETAKRLAVAGVGAVLMPTVYAEKELAEGKLFVLPIAPPSQASALFVSFNGKSEKEKIVSAFLAAINLERPI